MKLRLVLILLATLCLALAVATCGDDDDDDNDTGSADLRCEIDGEAYAHGEPNPANSCLICDVDRSNVSWSHNDGAACDDGIFCNGPDTCLEATCQVHPGDPCADNGLFCDGDDSCNEEAAQCDHSGDPCEEGFSCVEETDECVVELGSGVLAGYVRDYQTEQAVQGATVALVNDATGEVLGDDWRKTSGANGYVEFDNIPDALDHVGVRVTRTDHLDTYEYFFSVGAVNEDFLLFSEDTVTLMEAVLGLDFDSEEGLLIGGAYWGNPSDQAPIGCGVVQTDPEPANGVFYFGVDGLPTQDRSLSPNEPASAENGKGTSPINGRWLGANVAVGVPVTIAATSGDAVESVTIPQAFADSVTIADLFFSKSDYSTDPTEAWCTE